VCIDARNGPGSARQQAAAFDFTQDAIGRFCNCLSMKTSMDLYRLLHGSLVAIAAGGLTIGGAARVAGYDSLASQY
jgi:hypothetical protein